MTNRTVSVKLVAEVNSYLSGMDQAAKKTRELGTEAEKLAQKKQSFDVLGRSALAFGVIAAASAAIAVKKFAEFDQAMSNVQAATQESTANMGRLRDAALAAGADTVFSATEAAGAIEELGKAGLTTTDILDGGLNGALTLAAAGGIGVAEAAGYAAIAMKQFKLEGDKLPHVADLFAAGAGKAVGDVSDLAQALGQVGLVANGTGLSIEETTGTLAAFADSGLLGSDAGTAFKTMLGALTPNSNAARAAIDELNISAFDSQGAFIGMEAFAGKLAAGLSTLTDEQRATKLEAIYGQDAVRAATVVYDLGAKGIKGYIDQTNESGYAAKVAADRLDNLAGDVEKLGGSIDTALIKSGSGANDVLRDLTQTATAAVDAFGELPQPALDAGLAVTSVASATALAIGATVSAIPKISALKTAMADLNVSGRRVALTAGAAGTAIGVYTYFLATAAAKQADMEATGDELTDSLDKQTGAFTAYSREIVAARFQSDESANIFAKMGISLSTLTDAAFGVPEAMKAVADAQDAYLTKNPGENLNVWVGDADRVLQGLQEQISQAPTEWAALQQAANDAAGTMKSGLEETGAAATDASGDITALADSVANYGKIAFDTNAASRAFEDAIDSAKESLEENGKTLDIGTEKGRANQAALDAVAKSANELAAARYRETGSVEESSAALDRGRDKYVKIGREMGLTKNEAQAYADTLIATPDEVRTQVKLDGIQAAKDRLAGLIAQYKAGGSVTLRAVIEASDDKGYARGGYTGSIGRHNIAGVVHGEEYVSNAKTTANPANRAVLDYMQLGGSVTDYPTQGSRTLASMHAEMVAMGHAGPGNGANGYSNGYSSSPVYVTHQEVYNQTPAAAPVMNFRFDNFREVSVAEATGTAAQIAVSTLGLS